jgi:hypothetical protein
MIERLDINDAREWSEMDIADLKNDVAQARPGRKQLLITN